MISSGWPILIDPKSNHTDHNAIHINRDQKSLGLQVVGIGQKSFPDNFGSSGCDL